MTREHQHMTGISERLRNEVCLTSQLDWQEHVALARQAADTIDELVRALREIDHVACMHKRGAIGEAQWIARAALRRATGEE